MSGKMELPLLQSGITKGNTASTFAFRMLNFQNDKSVVPAHRFLCCKGTHF
jgi:hypothetical protein